MTTKKIREKKLPSQEIGERMIQIRLQHQEDDMEHGTRTILTDSTVFQQALFDYLDSEALNHIYGSK